MDTTESTIETGPVGPSSWSTTPQPVKRGPGRPRKEVFASAAMPEIPRPVPRSTPKPKRSVNRPAGDAEMVFADAPPPSIESRGPNDVTYGRMTHLLSIPNQWARCRVFSTSSSAREKADQIIAGKFTPEVLGTEFDVEVIKTVDGYEIWTRYRPGRTAEVEAQAALQAQS